MFDYLNIEDLLGHEYGEVFEDVKILSPANRYLWGLAVAIYDSHPNWRPKASELIELLPDSQEANKIFWAGAAYGAAKSIQDLYYGPAILLYGAALNSIGKSPQIELINQIDKAEKILKQRNIEDISAIRDTISAAKERAAFERVTHMLKQEFTKGLLHSNKYDETTIQDKVDEIVMITHDVRHKALIDRFGWAIKGKFTSKVYYDADPRKIKDMSSSSDIAFIHLGGGDVDIVSPFMKNLVPFAQIGCAHAILLKLIS